MRTVKLLTLAALVAVPASVSAQGMPFMSGGIDFFGGLAMPTGDFADDDGGDEESGFAGMGFMVGTDARLPLGTTPFGRVTTVSVNSFGFDAEEAFGDGVDGTRYWLIPITTGLSYPFSMSPTMSLVPMAQVGANIALGPKADADGGGEANAKMSFSLAFSAGADLMFTQNLGVTARYMNGGAPEREIEFDPGDDGEKDSPMSWLQLGVVYRFR